ncbi:MAG: tRNA-dihydrouridine synthase [Candidatus Saccharimonas sp.]
MTNFWQDLPKPFFILSPMEAVTDVVFRQVIAEAARPDVFFTEFTNTNSWCSPKGQHSTKGRLFFDPSEQPIVAHIWGDVPEYFAAMSQGMAEAGFAGIDINMGCPAPNVAPKGKGSGLINHFETAAAIIEASKAGGLPISVKTRLGYSQLDEMPGWIEHLLRQDIANLTVHLRTRKEMSKVGAHFETIDEIIKLRDVIAPKTLLTINGDIRDRAHGLELIEQHPGVDGIMIGRGVFHNPFAFELVPKEHDRQEFIDLLSLQLDLYDKYAEQTKRPFETLKRFFKIYIRDFDGASELRDKLMHTKSTEEARQIIDNLN